jgi:tetratricopeptide (TPR) repeat protein
VSGQAASIAFGETAPTRTLPSSCAPPAPPGPVIGRYQIHRRLGSGGMGTVFEAWDPQLARQVAIKVLHPSSTGDQAVLRELLVREAQAMAQLAHPNVVAVFDVGTAGQQLFIAMELVRGTTLAHYLQTRRSRREIVDAFAQAGRGLAAAHAAGLVHRDFKPANVLVGADGRVRVTDFGLARSPVAPGAGAGGVGLTHAGQLLGTPSYMSPEQWLGRPADARSDQWSFGVALFEALAGRHPFPAPAFDVLRASVLSGQRAPLPPDLPRALRGVVDRALKLRPEDRYPTMLALLADLDRERVSVVRRIGPYAVLVAGTSALAGAVAIAWPGAGTGGIAACERAADELDEVWDEERGEKLRSKVKGAGPAVEALDAYADAWRAMRTEACEAAARKEQSEELRDLRNACLDQRLALFSGAVRTIEKGAATEPLDLVGGLPPVADCADQERVRSGIYLPPDPEDRDKATEIWKQLGEAASYLDAGRFADAAPLIDRALASAKRLDWEPMIAEAEYRRASLLSRRGDHAGAERGFKDAFVSARAARHDEVMRWSAIQLVSVVGSDLHRPPDAEEWIKNARAEVKRATTDRRAQATLLEH